MEVVELFQNSEMEQYTSYVEIGRNVLAICSSRCSTNQCIEDDNVGSSNKCYATLFSLLWIRIASRVKLRLMKHLFYTSIIYIFLGILSYRYLTQGHTLLCIKNNIQNMFL